MNIFQLIGQIFQPAVELVDELHTSTEEKLAQKAAALRAYQEALEAGYAYELETLKTRASIVEAEAKGDGVLQRNWRPITMLTFLALAVGDSLGLLASPLAPEAWTLLQLGIGGYVVGRSVEKVAPAVVKTLKKKDEV